MKILFISLIFPAILLSTVFTIEFEDENWYQDLKLRNEKKWGTENFSIVYDKERKEKVLKVAYPKGSASPNVSKVYGAPVGGGEFLAQVGSYDSLTLEYSLKFSENFTFVKGGKLPGLFGGTANSGGAIPTGFDGFSTRMMWRENGEGELYAYMPSSKQWGTPIGQGKWRFEKNKWYNLKQKLVLNRPDKQDGKIKIWLNDQLIHEEKNLQFRKTDSLKIEGLFFSTFFGGNDTSWSAKRDCYVLFDDFLISQ